MPRVTITLPGESPQPYRFQLDRNSVVIGRADENDIQVKCASVSSRHAEMTRGKSGYELHDLGSTNGIKVDGKLVQSVALRDGMSVELGDVMFGFELSPEERAVLDMQASVSLKPDSVPKPSTAALQTSPSPQTSSSPPRAQVPRQAAMSTHGSSGGGSGLLLLVLALLAFCVGMAFRFNGDTGRSWLETVLSKYVPHEVLAPSGK